MTRAQLEAIVTQDEFRYDDHLQDFRQVVTLCEQFLDADICWQHTLTTRRAHDGVLCIALYLVGCKCRNPELRRRAIRLLYRSRRLEGLWSTTTNGYIAEQVMMLEEDTSKRPCALARILEPPSVSMS